MIKFVIITTVLVLLPVYMCLSDISAYDVLVSKNHSEYKSDSIFIDMVKIYQDYISPLNGSRCMFYPTCSQFFIESLKKYGLLWSILMTTDRMFYRENSLSIKRYKYIIKYGRYYDPIEKNYIFKAENR